MAVIDPETAYIRRATGGTAPAPRVTSVAPSNQPTPRPKPAAPAVNRVLTSTLIEPIEAAYATKARGLALTQGQAQAREAAIKATTQAVATSQAKPTTNLGAVTPKPTTSTTSPRPTPKPTSTTVVVGGVRAPTDFGGTVAGSGYSSPFPGQYASGGSSWLKLLLLVGGLALIIYLLRKRKGRKR